jgi:hypothetical protein
VTRWATPVRKGQFLGLRDEVDLFPCSAREILANLFGATSDGATDARANWIGGTFSTPDDE